MSDEKDPGCTCKREGWSNASGGGTLVVEKCERCKALEARTQDESDREIDMAIAASLEGKLCEGCPAPGVDTPARCAPCPRGVDCDQDEERDDSPYCDCGSFPDEEEQASNRCSCCGKMVDL